MLSLELAVWVHNLALRSCVTLDCCVIFVSLFAHLLNGVIKLLHMVTERIKRACKVPLRTETACSFINSMFIIISSSST